MASLSTPVSPTGVGTAGIRALGEAVFGSSKPNVGPSGVSSFYEIQEPDAVGKDVDFAQFRGKVVYAVNVASM